MSKKSILLGNPQLRSQMCLWYLRGIWRNLSEVAEAVFAAEAEEVGEEVLEEAVLEVIEVAAEEVAKEIQV